MNQEYELGLELVRIHTEKCISFISNISCKLNNFKIKIEINFFLIVLDKFSIEDQKILLINSVHPLRLIQLIRLQQKREQSETQPNLNANINYFDCDNATYEKIIKHFPVFDKILSYYKPLADLVRELKLDCKEFALFSAVLAFSTSNLN